MSREKGCYRDNLERLDGKFPNQEILSIKDVADCLGVDRRTVKKLYTFKKNYISKVKLASEMS